MRPPSLAKRALQKAKDPRRLSAAVLRRLLPRSPRYGFPWVHQPDGSITFRERGFVAAAGPSALLARHNYETRRIRYELAGRVFERSLEIGCGYGRLSMVFAEFSDEHIAVDINPDALALARTAYPDLTFRQTTPGGFEFPDAEFGLITTWTVIQHIPPDRLEQTCAEIKRMLVPGGTLLLCEETRDPGAYGDSTWHRTTHDYAKLFAPLTLERHGYISEIDRIPGMETPGEVMVFVSPTPDCSVHP